MKGLVPYTINVRGKLMDLSKPRVMGIVNVTPDSFYAGSRTETEETLRERVRQIVAEGGEMIDVGAYSSRPGAGDVSKDEEMERLRRGMRVVREEAPDVPVSVDTWRADVAKMCIEELGADIINDISGGQLDKTMFPTVAKLGVPYILMHNKPDPLCPSGISPSMGRIPSGVNSIESLSRKALPIEGEMPEGQRGSFLMKEVLLYFAEKVQRLRDLGQKDIILDPGYGFGKTLDHNYELMRHQEMLQVFELPILVGISRKSMIYKLLDCTPEEALNGTTVLNTLALQKGASILRVHDVKAAKDVVKICLNLV
ncbi:MAG: dihydropteroate synthase family protein [Bacteroidaceae bacterium]|nr:dihydropteroate synthase family protein [Bacteroidaceae bacterium]